jgi:hypothetical protein
MRLLPPTRRRVPAHSAPEANARIHRQAQARVAAALASGRVEERLDELEREWSTERALQTNFALVALASVGLAAFHDRRWLALTAAAAGFMVQHALQGWCPPLAVFRRRGFRDEGEIERERRALEAAAAYKP